MITVDDIEEIYQAAKEEGLIILQVCVSDEAYKAMHDEELLDMNSYIKKGKKRSTAIKVIPASQASPRRDPFA